MFPILVNLLLIGGLILILQKISNIIGEKGLITLREESTPFECGFEFRQDARVPFALSYFILTIIFLLFDLEIIFLIFLPQNFILNSSQILFIGTNFILILTLGLIYE